MLVVLKIKSKLNPDKVWEKHNHFIMHTQNREIMKEYYKKMDKTKPIFNNTGFRAVHYLTENRKDLIHVYFGTKELWEFDWKNHWQPHIDKGIWEVEKLVEENVKLPKSIDDESDDLFDWSMFSQWTRQRKKNTRKK